MKKWHLYVLRNSKGILYTGISKDMVRRINEHNNGTGAKFTRGRGPWFLAYSEGPFEHGEALREADSAHAHDHHVSHHLRRSRCASG